MNKHLTKVQVLLLGVSLATAALVLCPISWAQPACPPPGPGLQNMGPGGPPPGGPRGMGMMAGRGGPGQGMMPQERGQGRRDNVPGPLHALARGGMDGPGRGWEGRRMPDLWNHPEVQKKLELTEDQVKSLQSKRLELETQRIKVDADLEIAQLKLEDLIEQKEVDKEAIDAQIKVLGDLHAEHIRGMVHQKLALREVLNEEQLKKIDDFIGRIRSERLREVKERFQERGPDAKEKGRVRAERKQRPGGPMRAGQPKDSPGPASEEGESESSK